MYLDPETRTWKIAMMDGGGVTPAIDLHREALAVQAVRRFLQAVGALDS